jgi:protein SCO1/2
MVNARPCVPTGQDSTLPYYDSADFTPRWKATPPRPLAFELTSQSGEPVSARDLEGRIHVASFIFTRCSTVCPALVKQLKRVQAAAGNVRLVSFSVTPDLDTPATLAAYGAREDIDPTRWLLLTGNAATVTRLAREFYFADDGRLPSGSLLHTEKVLLVDGAGRLRGVYNGTVPFDIDRLIGDIGELNAGR